MINKVDAKVTVPTEEEEKIDLPSTGPMVGTRQAPTAPKGSQKPPAHPRATTGHSPSFPERRPSPAVDLAFLPLVPALEPQEAFSGLFVDSW